MAARNRPWLAVIHPGLWRVLLQFAPATGLAADSAFTNALAQAEQAEQQGNLTTALRIYQREQQIQGNDSSNLCVLTRKFCDLIRLTNSPVVQKDLALRALSCAEQ